MRILIIKMSSMGDIIHAMPALADAKAALPDITFDWCVEEAFAEIPALSANVERVIPIALRRWRKNLRLALKSGEVGTFWHALRQERYDAIIDLQGLLKSAIVARFARGYVAGFNRKALREPIAGLFYHKKITILDERHEIERMRRLFAKVLNYSPPTSPARFGIDPRKLVTQPEIEPYLLFTHAASWDNKLWPENYWIALSHFADQAGLAVQLPWGNENERARAERIAARSQNANVLPKSSITALASVMANSEGVIGVDTGLTYLAAALGVPTLQLYGPTDAARVAIVAEKQQQLSAEFSCAPCMKRSCGYEGTVKEFPACLARLTPEHVWNEATKIIKAREEA